LYMLMALVVSLNQIAQKDLVNTDIQVKVVPPESQIPSPPEGPVYERK
jgi:hypothetical protein